MAKKIVETITDGVDAIRVTLEEVIKKNRYKKAEMLCSDGEYREIIDYCIQPISGEYKLLFKDGTIQALNPMKIYIFKNLKGIRGIDAFSINRER